MSVTVAGLPFQFIQLNAAAGSTGFVFKSTKDAYHFSANTLTKITDPDYPATTVPGIAYLDGTFYVMTPEGRIYGSALENPQSWSALNVIQCQAEPDGGVAIARQLMYIIAFNAYSTEFFYDAGNPSGSPLLPITSAFIEVGCASAGSVAQTDNTTFFMGVTKQKGRSIYVFEGTVPRIVSNPFIDRVLNGDDLTKVYSYCVRGNGHIFYVLTLESVGTTLIYDHSTKKWHEWSSLVASSPKSVTSLTQVNGVATASATAHGFADGDPVVMAGAIPSGYNGTVNVTYVDANTFTYPVSSALTTPATGTITATGYTSSYFKNTFYTAAGNLDVMQGESDGNVYVFDPVTYQDNGLPIDLHCRTAKFDGGIVEKKHFHRIEIVGDKVDATMLLRYTDDDYQTWSTYRPVDLALDRAQLSRLGTARRRAFELRHTENTPIRLEHLDLNLDKGVA